VDQLQIVSRPRAINHALKAEQTCIRIRKRFGSPISLWADLTEKFHAIEKALPPELRRGVFQVEDKLIAWLAGQKLSGVNPWQDPMNSRSAAPNSS
jgi:hypothetical protein